IRKSKGQPGGGVGSRAPPTYSRDLETQLRDELFATYSELQRPEERVNVDLSLTLLTINDLDWTDDRLSWVNTSATSQDYSNIRFLFSTEKYVWRPAIIIENSVVDISVISDTAIPMRINSNGRVSWNPSGIYIVSCESDTTYYPMDHQMCTIKVSTWGYTQTEIQLLYDRPTPVDLSFYGANGEWDLISAVGTTTVDRSRGGQTFSSLSFQIELQRRPMFHVLNTLFPVSLMAFLIPMVFKLPPDSGEKIGYSLTVLLAYAVYLTLISENIPSTSVTICYLSIYLALTLMYGTLSVIFVIFVLMANHKQDEEEIPKWMRFLTLKILMPLTFWKGSCCCSKKRKDAVEPLGDSKIIIEVPNEKDCLKEFAKEQSSDDDLTWKTISLVLDKFFFLVLMTVVLVTTLSIFGIIAKYYTENS
ncbi:hypothetical protein FSP39_000208, partial [Pinctada imbricata]